MAAQAGEKVCQLLAEPHLRIDSAPVFLIQYIWVFADAYCLRRPFKKE